VTIRGTASIAIAAVSILVAGCAHHDQADTPPVVTVDVAPVLLSTIQQTVRADALLYPKQQAAIVPKVSSPIHAVHVTRGDHVKAGQLLLELESRDLAGAAAESRAAADLADATYATAARATLPQEAQKAELDVRAAKDALDAQQSVFDSRQALFKEGAIAQKDVNDAQSALSQARSQYESARRRLDDLKSFAGEQALKAAAAQRDVARAHNEAAQAQLGYTRVTSPIDGIVTELPFYAGESSPPGAPLVTVMDLSQVIGRAHVSQAEAALLKVGDDANLIGPRGTPIEAKVVQISPALDPGSTTVEVWVQADNADGTLRAGASMRVELIARTVNDALVIPERAVLTTPTGGTYAIVIDDKSKPHLRKVTIGVRDSGTAEVTDGLESGQRVATTGAFELFKLEPEVLEKVTVNIAPPKEEEEEPDET
jgi:multidrug efflux pump subunit AcrA (membrane-fusion protein)